MDNFNFKFQCDKKAWLEKNDIIDIYNEKDYIKNELISICRLPDYNTKQYEETGYDRDYLDYN